jgi:hypothetical protein
MVTSKLEINKFSKAPSSVCLDTPNVDKFIFDKIERKIKY